MISKKLEYYMNLPYKIAVYIEPDDGGYTAVLPELPGCMTTAEDFQSLQQNIEEAKKLWFQIALEDGSPIPEPVPLEIKEYSGKFITRLPKSVHKALAERAKAENTSLNQLVLTMLVRGLSSPDIANPGSSEER